MDDLTEQLEALAPLTPPRSRKRLDLRSSAERGLRKVHEQDFKTPPKIRLSDCTSATSGSCSLVSSAENNNKSVPPGLAAPRRSRRAPSSASSPSPRFRFQSIMENGDKDEDTKLADLITACVTLS